MRRSFAGICIALLVALVVPLQGLAAAQGDLCMGGGHHHSHDSGDGGDHHHGGHDDGKSSQHCPPCVACCAAAAISPSLSVMIADDRADTRIGATPSPLSGIQPGTLDRPPLAL